MRKITLLVSVVFVFLSFSPAFGKNLYVDISVGNDSVTYDQNSESNPWATIGRAAWGSPLRSSANQNQAARAGDIVIVKPGTYSAVGTSERFDPVYNPVNSGLSGNPIVFQSEGNVRLNLSSGAGPIIGANNRDYIVWKGFYVNELTAPSVSDTGSVVLFSTRGSVIENCVIDGAGTAGGRLDNHTGIRLERATNVTVRNNHIYNVLFGNGSYHHNGSGVMSYYSESVLIEKNTIHNCGSGIFVKGGDNRDFTIRYNWVRNSGKGIVFMYTSSSGQHNVYQNVCQNNNDAGVSINLYSRNINVVNNTLVDNQNGVVFGAHAESMENINIWNNIVYGASEGVSGGEASMATPFVLDYNLYYNISGGWSIAFSRYTTIETWRNALGGSNSGDEYQSIINNPGFDNYANNNFRLRNDSPAVNAGMDFLDLNRNGRVDDMITVGAYITNNEQIGFIEGGDDSTMTDINSPSGLRVVE